MQAESLPAEPLGKPPYHSQTTGNQDKEEMHEKKTTKKKTHLTYRGTKIRITSDIQIPVSKKNILSVEDTTHQPRIL